MTLPYNIHKNMSLREAKVVARVLGATVLDADDVIFTHPLMPRERRAGSRHDAGGHLVSWLRRLSGLRAPSPTPTPEEDTNDMTKYTDMDASNIPDAELKWVAGYLTTGMTIRQISEELNINKDKAKRIVAAMRNEGWIFQNGFGESKAGIKPAIWWLSPAGYARFFPKATTMEEESPAFAPAPVVKVPTVVEAPCKTTPRAITLGEALTTIKAAVEDIEGLEFELAALREENTALRKRMKDILEAMELLQHAAKD